MERRGTSTSGTLAARIRAMLPVLPLYLRLLPVILASLVCRISRRIIGAAATQRLERICLGLCNGLFRAPFDPAQFIDFAAFIERQDTSDFFTLCRRVGIYDPWFRECDVLDIGCGPGTFTLAVAERGVRSIEGIDIAAKRIAFANDRARSRGLSNARFHHASVYELPFAPGSFDRIMSHTVFEHLPDVPGALHAMFNLLRPGGEVVFTHDSYRCRYGAHVSHFVYVPWPCGFFSPDSVADFWERRCAAFLRRRGLAEKPELLDLADGLWSLNRVTMTQLEDAVARSGFEVVAIAPYGHEKALLELFPRLRQSRIGDYLTGSRVIRLRKPVAA